MADIAMQIDVAGEPKAILEALTSTDGVAGWWTTRNETSGTPGAINRYWFPGMESTHDMRVIRADEDAVEWECVGGPPQWIGTRVRWTLMPGRDGGTVVLLDHTGFPAVDTMYRIVTVGWVQMILRLKEHVETGKPVPYFSF